MKSFATDKYIKGAEFKRKHTHKVVKLLLQLNGV